MNRIGRLTVATASAGVLLVAGAGSAFAHECYNAKRSANGNAGAAGSAGWNTFAEDAAFFFPGLCAAGVEILADAAGVTPETPVLAHATMASGVGRELRDPLPRPGQPVRGRAECHGRLRGLGPTRKAGATAGSGRSAGLFGWLRPHVRPHLPALHRQLRQCRGPPGRVIRCGPPRC